MSVQLRIGFEIIYGFFQPTPLVLVVNTHDSRTGDIIVPDDLRTTPAVPINAYVDAFGNRCQRVVAPAGRFRMTADGVIRDNGMDEVPIGARQDAVEDLPEHTLGYLMGSRYCETDLLTQTAWQLFGCTFPGYSRVQAICDFVHNHIVFDYQSARNTRTAAEAFREGVGVCRDYAHLAIAFCRSMNIPARYCTGYLGDVGVPPPYPPGDFSAWFEAWIGGRWFTFDARHNVPRMSRVLMARGRDAADVAIITTFGPGVLESFRVWTDEIPEGMFGGAGFGNGVTLEFSNEHVGIR
jgi:transglutaminase-like putative cysteine protease